MNLRAENNQEKDKGVPTALRVPSRRRAQLQLIQQELRHRHLSDTINLAIDRLVEQYLRGEVRAA